MRRPSLSRLLRTGIRRPLLLVYGGTGYGKSAEISAFLHTHHISFCWLRIEESDSEPRRFFSYLIESLRTRYPSFAQEGLSDKKLGESGVDPEQYVAAWIKELSQLPEKVVLVLDDFHHVEQVKEIREWLWGILPHLPEQIHLVITSQRVLDWDLFASMRVKGELQQVSQEDLAWSKEEIEVYLVDVCRLAVQEEHVQLIYQETKGWAVAVQALAEEILLKKDLTALSNVIAEVKEDLFRYLEISVWNPLPQELKELLERLAIRQEWTSTWCSQILDLSGAEKVLKNLAHHHLFFWPSGSDTYCFHPLFRSLIQKKCKVEEKTLLHKQAARYFEEKGHKEEALYHLKEAGEEEALAQFLAQYGLQIIRQGELALLEGSCQLLSVSIKDQYYRVWTVEGEMNRYRSLYSQALDCYERGAQLAREAEDPLAESAALEGQACVYLDTIQPREAEKFLNRALKILDHIGHQGVERERIERLIAENMINLGQVEDVTSWIESSLMEEEIEARLHLRTGRLNRAKQILERKRRGETQEMNTLPRSHRETSVLLSLIYSMMGEPEKAKTLAQAGIVHGVEIEAPFVEACGWMRMGHAVQLLSKYELQLAADCYHTALEIMDQLQVPRGKAEPLMGLALLYGRDGAVDLAFSYGEQALVETEKVKDRWLSTLIRLSMGIALAKGGRWEEAGQQFRECHHAFLRYGDSYGAAVTLLWEAIVAYEIGDDKLFLSRMETLLQRFQTGSHSFLLQKKTLFGPSDLPQIAKLLIEAQKKGLDSQYVSVLLAGMGLDKATSHPGYTLRIQTLGDFRVWLGEVEVKATDWQREKAKELFQLLLTKRNQLLTREEIITFLWGDADPKAAARDFKVALNALNKALEPERSARETPFFIQRHGSLYGFNLASGFELDVVEFERLMQSGLDKEDPSEARDQLMKGLELYKGSYLPERRYEDWCLEERERLQVLFLRGAERLANLLVEEGSYDAAIAWCERIIAEDPCWEEAYRLLMLSFYHKNNRPQAIKWYRRCCATLERELGIGPMQKTVELYQQMMGEGA